MSGNIRKIDASITSNPSKMRIKAFPTSMSDILEIPSSSVSYLRFSSHEKDKLKHLAASEEGHIALLYSSSIIIGVIECESINENKKYILNEDKVDFDFSCENIFKIADYNLKGNEDPNEAEKLFNFLLDENCCLSELDIEFYHYKNIEWSPLDVFANKSYLALSRFDSRLIILSQNQTTKCWKKEFDLTDSYHRYYKDYLLESPIENGLVNCKNAYEFIKVKNDTKLVDYSWSMLVRHHKSEHYSLIVTISNSGIVTIWRIVADQHGCHCDWLFTERLDLKGIKPLIVKFCDISDTQFLLTVVDSRDFVIAFPFSIVSADKLTVCRVSEPLIVSQQMRYCQATKIHWSMKLSQLIIGFEWKLLITKINQTANEVFEIESSILYLPSSSEVSGLSVKDNVAYVTTNDGFFFGIRLSSNITSLELNQIIFQNAELNGNNEFSDVFVSVNSVHLGFIKTTVNMVNRQPQLTATVVMVSLMNENQALSVLTDDNVPFSRKQDAVEEMKHLYSNKKEHLQESLKKIGNSDIQWDNSTLHRLQFVRYICVFFGYKLNQEFPHSVAMPDDIKKIRKLESIILMKNIACWLDGFCELNNEDISRNDCLYVLKVIGKLSLVPDNHIAETIEAANNKAVTVLKTVFNTDEVVIQRDKDVNKDTLCPSCSEQCEFNLFTIKCSQGHTFPRCCKSLLACINDVKLCQMCGAKERVFDTKDLSAWRLEIINSNCPLCDSKLLHTKT